MKYTRIHNAKWKSAVKLSYVKHVYLKREIFGRSSQRALLTQFSFLIANSRSRQMDREDEDFGEGYIAESHPLRPTHLSVPQGGRNGSRAPSISSSVSDLDVPIYTRETTVPLSAKKVSPSLCSSLGNILKSIGWTEYAHEDETHVLRAPKLERYVDWTSGKYMKIRKGDRKSIHITEHVNLLRSSYLRTIVIARLR